MVGYPYLTDYGRFARDPDGIIYRTEKLFIKTAVGSFLD